MKLLMIFSNGISGNDWIHLLTTNCSYRVRFDLVSFRGRWAYAEYSNSRIGPESDNYRLHISGYYGNASKYNFNKLPYVSRLTFPHITIIC